MGERSATSKPHILYCPTRAECSKARVQRGATNGSK